MLRFSRKGIILSNLNSDEYNQNLWQKTSYEGLVELWLNRGFRRVLKIVLWGNLGWKRFPNFPFRLCEVQILSINNHIKLYYQKTSCEKEISQFYHVEWWYPTNRNKAHKFVLEGFELSVTYSNDDLLYIKRKRDILPIKWALTHLERAITQRGEQRITFTQKISSHPVCTSKLQPILDIRCELAANLVLTIL